MRKRGFTLIELLVVIAIIAILAAILFPVFAQARVSAKGAASLSNIKQHITAWLMYASDYDDHAVPLQNGSPSPLLFDGMNYSPWGWLLNPYRKEPLTTQDPLVAPNDSENGIPQNILWPFRPQYGYAFTIWSPVDQVTSDGRTRAMQLTAANSPAETVVFTGRKNRRTLDWRFVGTILWMAQAVAPPFCNGAPTDANARTGVNPDSLCAILHRWGTEGSSGLNPEPTDTEGRRTGSVAIRKTNLALVAMSDGSARFMPPARLAAGTNWHWNMRSADIRLTDRTQYLWDHD